MKWARILSFLLFFAFLLNLKLPDVLYSRKKPIFYLSESSENKSSLRKIKKNCDIRTTGNVISNYPVFTDANKKSIAKNINAPLVYIVKNHYITPEIDSIAYPSYQKAGTLAKCTVFLTSDKNTGITFSIRYASDTFTKSIRVKSGKDTINFTLPVKNGPNIYHINFKNNDIPLSIQGIHDNYYISMHLSNISPLVKFMRDYFSNMPFVHFFYYMSISNGYRCFFTDSVTLCRKMQNIPLLFSIGGQNGRLQYDTKSKKIFNSNGIYVIFQGRIFPTPIKSYHMVSQSPDFTVVSVKSMSLSPLLYIKGNKAYVTTEEFYKIAMQYPELFKHVMDSIIKIIVKPKLIVLPECTNLRPGEILKMRAFIVPQLPYCIYAVTSNDTTYFIKHGKYYEAGIQVCERDTSIKVYLTNNSQVYDSCAVGITQTPYAGNIIYLNKKEFYARARQFKKSYLKISGRKSRHNYLFLFLFIASFFLSWITKRRYKT